MRYGGTVGGSAKKRIFFPDFLKEKFAPLYPDSKMPYEHFMKVKWNIDVIKFGLFGFYSEKYHSKEAMFEFLDLCEESTYSLIEKMNDKDNNICKQPFNLLIKPIENYNSLNSAHFDSNSGSKGMSHA